MAPVEDNIKSILKELPRGVELVAVSKFRPVEELMAAYNAGQRVFAESRPLEFEAKVSAMPSDVQWHFIGHLQTNKLKHVLPYASLIQSVDSIHLLDAIERFSAESGKDTKVLLEVHIAEENTKQGFSAQEVVALMQEYAYKERNRWAHVRICGLMGMASHTVDSKRINEDFAEMKRLFDDIRVLCEGLTDFRELSIGMSDDWRIAIRHGATCVRIGSAIFLKQDRI